MNNKLIKPRTLKGFRDFLPQDKRLRDKVINLMRESFEKYGFEPLETVDLEYKDVLMGKYGEEEKLVYFFQDKGGRDVGLRYDLTVPAARVLAQYQSEIPLPFKRYQIQKVWRAEKPQRGRFRELYQCDADTFGSASMVVDAEYLAMSAELLCKLGFKKFEIRLNNRKILDAIFKFSGAKGEFSSFISAIDKYDKIGSDGVSEELRQRGFDEDAISQMQRIFEISGSNEEILNKLEEMLGQQNGIEELREILSYQKGKDGETYVRISPILARGLAYYTGPIWEIVVLEANIGSVAGGGRYNELVGSFLGKDIPATGGTWGLERLVEVIKERKMMKFEESNIDVLVTIFDEKMKKDSFEIAQALRERNTSVMLYPNADGLGKQFKYADAKGIQWAIILGEDELKQDKVTLRNMKTGEQEMLGLEEVAKKIRRA